MSTRMNWQNLLNTKRVSDFDKCDTKNLPSQFEEPRSPFEKDFDQITFSYPFRRLQDKTQVIPFPKFDFVPHAVNPQFRSGICWQILRKNGR